MTIEKDILSDHNVVTVITYIDRDTHGDRYIDRHTYATNIEHLIPLLHVYMILKVFLK